MPAAYLADPFPAPDDDADAPTLLLTITGEDRPGVTSALFEVLAAHDVTVLDVEQVVVRGALTLAVLVTGGSDRDAVRDALDSLADDLGIRIRVRKGHGDNRSRRTGRVVVVLLGRPLHAAAMSAVAAEIAAQGANIDRIRRLSRYPVTTVELDVSGADLATLRTVLAGVAAGHGVDVAVAPSGLSRRGHRLVVMDVDSTFIRQEVIEMLAAHAGREDEVAAITDAAMRGELDFAESLAARVELLAGLDASVLNAVRDEVVLTPGARTLVRTLHRLGFSVALVSGGFEEIVAPIAKSLGIEHIAANRLEVVEGRLTGRTEGPVVDRAAKAEALRRFAAIEDLPLSRTVAIGDGANDLDMLQTAGLGIAFNAKPLVRERADTAVNVPYLDSVLFLLGITRDDIEEADEEALAAGR